MCFLRKRLRALHWLFKKECYEQIPSNLAQVKHQMPHCVDYVEEVFKKADIQQVVPPNWPRKLGKVAL